MEAVVFGRVQGVFFRHHTALMARQLGLTGTVENQPDGTILLTLPIQDAEALAALVQVARQTGAELPPSPLARGGPSDCSREISLSSRPWHK